MHENLKDVVIEILNPITVKTVEEDGNVKILVPSSVDVNGINVEMLKCGEVELDKVNPKQYLKKGDILFQAKGNKFEAILIEEEYKNLVASSLYFIIRVNTDKIDPKYLQWLLKTGVVQEYFDKNTSGTAIKTVRKTILEEFKFICPPLVEQEKIVVAIRAFENEKKETLKYLESKEEFIEIKILSKYEVK